MSLLTMMQSVCLRVGLPSPNAVFTSTDQQIQQLLALANEEVAEICARFQWTGLTRTGGFITVANGLQTNFSTYLSPANGLNYIINDTLWNQDLRLPVFGPLSQQQNQLQINWLVNGPWQQYVFDSQGMNFIPAPAADQTINFSWVTKNGIRGQGVPATIFPIYGNQTAFAADTDVTVLDETIIALGIIWRWKQVKGLAYAEDFAKYERRVMDAMARDGTKPILNTGVPGNLTLPGTYLPAGSWMTP